MTWWAEHRDIVVGLLVALFGAGGAGAILFQWLLRDRGKKSVETPTAPPATGNTYSHANHGGIIVHKRGPGNVTVEQRGEMASAQTMHAWRTRGFAQRDFAGVLWRAAEHARLTDRQMEQIAQDPSHEREFEALRDAVDQGNIEAAACQLRALAERTATATRSD
jgi:hypothetical protein